MNQFHHKTIIITGGAQGIGWCIANEFHKQGANICIIDRQPIPEHHWVQNATLTENRLFHLGDIADRQTLEDFVNKVIAKFGKVDYLVNNALPVMKGLDECSYEDFQYALNVGVVAPFYLVKLLSGHWAESASIVNISSSRAFMSQPQTESYTAAKGGITALTHALAVSLAGKVRVNSIAPGWIDTTDTLFEGADAQQQPAGRVGKPIDIAQMVMFLCSEKAGFITGENITIDGGMTKQMIYHGDYGWRMNLED